MKSKTKFFTDSFYKMYQSFGIILLLLLFNGNAKAQHKFELLVNGNTGYYFTEGYISGYNIKNGLQFGFGSQVKYNIIRNTKIGLGFNFNYIKSSEKTFYSPSPLIPNLNAIEIPFTINRELLKNWFIATGTAIYWHTDRNFSYDRALGKWEIGTGYRFKKLEVSLNYSQNFENQKIKIDYAIPNHYGFTEYKRKILYLKLEYPLWKF